MKRNSSFYAVLILAIGLLALWGCPKKAEVSSVQESMDSARNKSEAEAAERKRDREAEARAKEAEAKERAATAAAGLRPIYYDFDQSNIRSDARAAMKANAEWMKSNPKANVRIEAHCDERGTIEYNQALGQRRGQSAKKYLTDLGISARRISLISYGKEKPVCTASTEECLQKNRRADLIARSE